MPLLRLDQKVSVPEPLRELRDWFNSRPEFEVVQIFAFPVVGDREKPAPNGQSMGYLSLPSVLAVWMASRVAQSGEAPPGAPVAPVPQLSKEDSEWVVKKYKQAADEYGRKGKWGVDEAQAPVREILDLCTRKLGKDHYFTAWYRREIEGLEILSKLPEADRVEYMK